MDIPKIRITAKRGWSLGLLLACAWGVLLGQRFGHELIGVFVLTVLYCLFTESA